MRVEFIKDYTDEHGRNWKKGKRTHVTKEFGKDLIKQKVANQIKNELDEKAELIKKLQKSGIEIHTK